MVIFLKLILHVTLGICRMSTKKMLFAKSDRMVYVGVRQNVNTWSYKYNVLNVAGNMLTSVSQTTFQGLISLKKLSLKQNRIWKIDYRFLELLPFLEHLDLSHNNVQDIEKDGDGLNIYLESINLSKNKVEHITENAFFLMFLPALRILDLSRNHIVSIEVNLVGFTINLEALYVTEKFAEDISQRVVLLSFRMLDYFSRLSCKTEIEFFHYNKILETLCLEGNQSGNISKSVFKKIIHAWHVGLRVSTLVIQYSNMNKTCNSNMCDMKSYCHDALSSTLDLDGNRIQFLKRGFFMKFTSFAILALQDNWIREMEPGCFLGLCCLQELYLTKNLVSTSDFNHKMNPFYSMDRTRNDIRTWISWGCCIIAYRCILQIMNVQYHLYILPDATQLMLASEHF